MTTSLDDRHVAAPNSVSGGARRNRWRLQRRNPARQEEVPGKLIASTTLGMTALLLAYVSLWPRIDHLQYGAAGWWAAHLSYLFVFSFPMSLLALLLATSYRRSRWASIGRVRVSVAIVCSLAALILSLSSAWVLYDALP